MLLESDIRNNQRFIAAPKKLLRGFLKRATFEICSCQTVKFRSVSQSFCLRQRSFTAFFNNKLCEKNRMRLQ